MQDENVAKFTKLTAESVGFIVRHTENDKFRNECLQKLQLSSVDQIVTCLASKLQDITEMQSSSTGKRLHKAENYGHQSKKMLKRFQW